jgi:hypothetical protein
MATTEATSNDTILCVRVRVFYLIDSDAGALSRLRTYYKIVRVSLLVVFGMPYIILQLVLLLIARET